MLGQITSSGGDSVTIYKCKLCGAELGSYESAVEHVQNDHSLIVQQLAQKTNVAQSHGKTKDHEVKPKRRRWWLLWLK